jgi:hypothetical protein
LYNALSFVEVLNGKSETLEQKNRSAAGKVFCGERGFRVARWLLQDCFGDVKADLSDGLVVGGGFEHFLIEEKKCEKVFERGQLTNTTARSDAIRSCCSFCGPDEEEEQYMRVAAQ